MKGKKLTFEYKVSEVGMGRVPAVAGPSRNSSMESRVLIAHSGASAENQIIQTHVQLAFLYLYF